MKVEWITQEAITQTLRQLRTSAGLRQKDVADRSQDLEPPFERLTTKTLSQIERNQIPMSFGQFLSILVGCSHQGDSLSFWHFEQDLRSMCAADQPVRREETAAMIEVIESVLLRLQRTIDLVKSAR